MGLTRLMAIGVAIPISMLVLGCQSTRGGDPNLRAELSSPGAAEQANYRAAAKYSNARNGFAVLVQKGGHVVFEDYHGELNLWQRGRSLMNPGGPDKPHRLASGTKSFWGLAACAAATDGLLDLDEKVSGAISEWKGEPGKSEITVRELLSLTSGLETGGMEKQPTIAEAIAMGARRATGSGFQYDGVPFQVFGELLRRKLAPHGGDALGYLTRRILDPIGMKVGLWTHDAEGNANMPSGAFLTAREWAKVGQLILDGGRFEGRAIISEDILPECFRGSKVNPEYGLTFWLNEPGTIVKKGSRAWINLPYKPIMPELIPDLIMAMGHGKQRLYIIPSLKLVVVRFGESDHMRWNDADFLGLILGKR
jgi:CubicO group peptidase (beta-lactamase class C family)